MLKPLVVGSMSVNAYIFSEDENTCVVFDPGGDLHYICAEIDKADLTLQGIVCTHGHLDHTSEVGPLMEWARGKGFKPYLAIHELDREYLGENSENTHRTSFASFGIINTGFFSTLYNPSPDPTLLLKEGDTVPGTDFITIHTPGHTEGSVCFYHSGRKICLSGDTLFCGGIGRSDLPGGNGRDLVQSIKEKLYILPEEIKVYPGHGPETDIGTEKKTNYFVR